MKIAICIPCAIKDVQYIERLLYSIEQQTVHPDIVCISISGVTHTIPSYTSSFKLRIIQTPDQKNAGENRNIAALAVYENVDIISFIDADDYMHPRRTESLLYVFNNNICDVFLHGYKNVSKTLCKLELELIAHNIDISGDILDSLELQPTNFIHANDGSGHDIPIHNGHISCKSSIYHINNVPENAVWYEDSKYTGDLFIKGYRCRFTPDKLSLYCR